MDCASRRSIRASSGDEVLLPQIAVQHRRHGGTLTDGTSVLAVSKINDPARLATVASTTVAYDLRAAVAAVSRVRDPGRLAEIDRTIAATPSPERRFLRQVVAFRRAFASALESREPGIQLEIAVREELERTFTNSMGGGARLRGSKMAITVTRSNGSRFERVIATDFPQAIKLDANGGYRDEWWAPPFDTAQVLGAIEKWWDRGTVTGAGR